MLAGMAAGFVPDILDSVVIEFPGELAPYLPT